MGSIYTPPPLLIKKLTPPAVSSIGCLLLSAETLSGNCPQLPHPRSHPSLGAFHIQCLLCGGRYKAWQGRSGYSSMEFPTGMTRASIAAALRLTSSLCLIWPLSGVFPMVHSNKPPTCKSQSLRICFLGTQPTRTSTFSNLRFLLRNNPLSLHILKSERNLIRTIFLGLFTIIVPAHKS